MKTGDTQSGQGEFKESDLVEAQKKILAISRENTLKTLKAIKEGKVQVDPQVKAEAEKALAQLESVENPLETAQKQYSTKLEDIMSDENAE